MFRRGTKRRRNFDIAKRMFEAYCAGHNSCPFYSTKKKNQSEKLRKIALTPTPTPAQVDGLDLLKAQNQESDFIHVSKKCYI
jgi:hypothetical protein